MGAKQNLYRLVAVLVIIAVGDPLAGASAAPALSEFEQAQVSFQEHVPVFDSGLYRTSITVRNPSDWARIESMGIVFLERGETTALLLVDDEQLATLARLQFRPRGSDELGALVRAQGPTRDWLAASVQPLLDQGAALQAQKAANVDAESIAGARQALRAAMQSLSPEQIAAIGDSFSVDDDGDGLSNTEEIWWCTDPQDDNTDDDTFGYKDGEEIHAQRNKRFMWRAGVKRPTVLTPPTYTIGLLTKPAVSWLAI